MTPITESHPLKPATTMVAQWAHELVGMYNSGVSLTGIKSRAKFCGLTLEGNTFDEIQPELVEFRRMALSTESIVTRKDMWVSEDYESDCPYDNDGDCINDFDPNEKLEGLDY